MKFVISNLSSDISIGLLKSAFEIFGSVSNITISKENNSEDYFAQVEMPNDNEAESAIKLMSGKEIEGRLIKISHKLGDISENIDTTKSSIIEEIQDKSKSISDMSPAMDIHEYSRMTDENRRDKSSDRRTIQSPLFNKEKGIVIDRRINIDRRDSLDSN